MLFVVLSFGLLVATALAGTPTLTLSTRGAITGLRTFAAADHPHHVTVDRCKRLEPNAVSCRVTEYGATLMITENEHPATGSLRYTATATKTWDGLRISSSLFQTVAL